MRMLVSGRLLVVGLLLAVVSASGFARSGLLSSARQAIKQHGARGVATAGAILMLCAGGCEQMQKVNFVASGNPADTSSGSVDNFRNAGEKGSYVGSSVEWITRAPGGTFSETDEVLRIDYPAGLMVFFHERSYSDTYSDLVIDMVDSGTGVLSERHYLFLESDNGSYTLYDRLGPGRTRLGEGRDESDHLRLSFSTPSLGTFDIIAYIYDPVIDQFRNRVGRLLRIEYPNRPWGFGTADLEVLSQMYWSSTQTVIAENQPATVGLRSVGDVYLESYPSGHSNRVVFSANHGVITLGNRVIAGHATPIDEFFWKWDVRMTADESHDASGDLSRLSISLNREGNSMQLDLDLARSKDSSGNGYRFNVSDPSGQWSGTGELSDAGVLSLQAFNAGLGSQGTRVDIEFLAPQLSNNNVQRKIEIRFTYGEEFSTERGTVLGQSYSTLAKFEANLNWDAVGSARLSE